ncbi:MAG: hypothetical protein QXU18_15325, partial [Thermoplasmatales archaeon]
KFSVPEDLNLSNVTWFVNGTFYSRGYSIEITFRSPAIYNISVSDSNGYYASINYTVDPRLNVHVEAPPNLAYTGITFYLVGNVSGGTIFSGNDYQLSLYINGAYQLDILNSSYSIPFTFNKPGNYNVTLIVSDNLLEKVTLNFEIKVINKPITLAQQIKTNLSPGTIFYLIILGCFITSIVLYEKGKKR